MNDEGFRCVNVYLQEVTLRRASSDDRLGLTLYYRDTHNSTSDVIVGEVSPPNQCTGL